MSTARWLKQRIKDGEVVVALRPPIAIGRDALEAALSKGTYDLIYIDGQHTAFSDDQLVAICGAAEALGMPVQFRIPHTRLTFLIGRYPVLGRSAILVPKVVAPATADEADPEADRFRALHAMVNVAMEATVAASDGRIRTLL